MILDVNPFTGEVVTFDYDHATDSVTIGHHQDCEPIIDDNKRLIIEADHSQQIKNDWIRYARIPNILAVKWKQELGIDIMTADMKTVMMLVNSRDFRDTKTTTIHHDR